MFKEYDDAETGFRAVVSKNGADEYIVTFTRTEPNGTDSLADLHLGRTQWEDSSEAQRLRSDLAGFADNATIINFTGHSLGGG